MVMAQAGRSIQPLKLPKSRRSFTEMVIGNALRAKAPEWALDDYLIRPFFRVCLPVVRTLPP